MQEWIFNIRAISNGALSLYMECFNNAIKVFWNVKGVEHKCLGKKWIRKDFGQQCFRVNLKLNGWLSGWIRLLTKGCWMKQWRLLNNEALIDGLLKRPSSSIHQSMQIILINCHNCFFHIMRIWLSFSSLFFLLCQWQRNLPLLDHWDMELKSCCAAQIGQ